MRYIREYKSFYKVGDIVTIEYWYNDMITYVRIVEIISRISYKVTHNIPESEIRNAPDEILKSKDIIDIKR